MHHVIHAEIAAVGLGGCHISAGVDDNSLPTSLTSEENRMATTAAALDDVLLSPQQLADYLGVPLATVYRWRCEGTGPRGIKVGKHVRYRQRDVEAWLDTRSDPNH